VLLVLLVVPVPATAPLLLREPDAVVELVSVLELEALGEDDVLEDEVLGVLLATD
jgi:hypothetical protein